MPPEIPDILARIVARKREEQQESILRASDLRAAAELFVRRNFAYALTLDRPAVIAEIKKGSPSQGIMLRGFNPVILAAQYMRGGAVAISVLTDKDFFHGSMTDLHDARMACTLPVLRKDFTVDEFNVLEAAGGGADAILLIAAILDEHQLRGYRELAATFGMASLVEVHNEAELEMALRSGAEIVGVNNRNLHTFEVSLETSLNLAAKIPNTVIKVSESGIKTNADVQMLMEHGYNAILVGEQLIRSEDPGQAILDLVGR